MKKTGKNTAAREMVMETMVKLISREPSRAAARAVLPISRWRTMFSSMTMASSTTNPTESVSAISEMLSRLNSSRYMAAKVPTTDMGRARLGMTVAGMLRKNRKMPMTTRHTVKSRVNFTSDTESRMDTERS